MRISFTPILLAVELGFLFLLAWRCGEQTGTQRNMGPVYTLFFWVTAYGIVASVLGARGVYISDDLLKTLPGFWLQVVTVGAVVIPDFLFGVSAFWIARKAQRGDLSRKKFVVWNLVGVLVIVPSAPILLQLGLPGPVQVFTSVPDARAVFTYPMSIAPMIGVPLFVLVDLWVVWRLWEQGHEKEVYVV